MPDTKYSTTPLIKKLGIKSGHIVALYDAPVSFLPLLEPIPEEVLFSADKKTLKNVIIVFITQQLALNANIDWYRSQIVQEGMLWVAWPKKTSKIPREVNEDFIRDTAIAHGLVDVKVCSIDADWSGLKLVIPLKARV
jgi:hypothetical protein